MIVRWLHLSDFHLQSDRVSGMGWEVKAFEQDVVVGSMMRFIEDEVVPGLDGEELDFILVTGDVAYSATKAQYEVAAGPGRLPRPGGRQLPVLGRAGGVGRGP